MLRKRFNSLGLIVTPLVLVFMLWLCGCSNDVKYHYPKPKNLMPYETIMEEYHPTVGENITEREVQEFFAILKSLYDKGGYEYGENTIYISEPYVRINLYVVSIARVSNIPYIDETGEFVEVWMGVHEGDRFSLYGWGTDLYFDRAWYGGWDLIYFANIQE
jgi:hypothetical protein